MTDSTDRVACVGGIVVHDGPAGRRLLLVLRGRDPWRGTWSVPGGRVEPGETDVEATARELLEETGLRVAVGALLGSVERDGPGGSTYVIRDYVCTPAYDADVDAVRGGDDAAEAAWFTVEKVRRLPCSPGLVDALTGWGVL